MKLIGLIRLPIVKILTPPPLGDVWEAARNIAFDQDGRAWLLVERIQRFSSGHTPRKDMLRIDYLRWQLAEQLPISLEPAALVLEGSHEHESEL